MKMRLSLSLLAILLIHFVSCKKETSQKEPTSNNEIATVNATTTTVLPAANRTITDIRVAPDGIVYVMEGHRLKKLTGSTLTEVTVPAGLYTDFTPSTFWVTSDNTIYFRALDKLKIVLPNGTVKSHAFEVPYGDPVTGEERPDRYTNLNYLVEGEGLVGYNEVTKSVILINFYPPYEDVLGFEFRDGVYTSDYFHKYINYRMIDFDICSNGTVVAVGGNQLLGGRLARALPNGTGKDWYQVSGSGSLKPLSEGPLDKVWLNTMIAVAVSGDGKSIFYIDKIEPNTRYTSGLKRIDKNLQVTIVNTTAFTNMITASFDGKTIYSVVNGGIQKIQL